MNELAALIAEYGFLSLLNHIHAMVALAEKDGELVTYNRAFEDFKLLFPSAKKLGDFFVDAEGFQNKVLSERQERWVAELISVDDEKSLHCDCLLLPLKNGQLLFVGEYIQAELTLINKIQHLSRQVDMFKVENQSAQKIMKRKQVEIDGVLAQAQEILKMDSLTFLPNRRMIIQKLQDETLRAERYDTPLSVSVVDVDHFKRINDTYGHVSGDEVLRQVGYLLRDHIRHPDVAGRFGGEEFLIILPNSTAQAAAEQAARLCRKVSETVVHVKQHSIQVTISIGIAEFKKGIDTWETLLNRADTAMYEAKRAGRNQWMTTE